MGLLSSLKKKRAQIKKSRRERARLNKKLEKIEREAYLKEVTKLAGKEAARRGKARAMKRVKRGGGWVSTLSTVKKHAKDVNEAADLVGDYFEGQFGFGSAPKRKKRK